MIDSGVDLRHRDLKHHLWLNHSEKAGAAHDDDDLNGFVDDTRGWNFVADNGDVSDDLGHGAQVAGIIASQLDHQPSISILPLKVLNHTGEGTVADVVEAMDYAVARRAAVINCSFGAPAFSHAMLDAIKRAETASIVVVAAAGNRSRSLSESPFYPASYRAHQAPNLISVAATDRNQLLAGFSNFAADIAAPGENIRTAHRGNSYIRLTGTSASAGFVAATAGLLKRVRGWVSAQTIRQTVLKSASESFDLKDKVASKGALNAAAALSLFTRNHSTINMAPGKAKHISPLARKIAAQSGANLDTMRSSQPQAPNAYQQTGTLPPASYDDPKPTITANYDAYLTQLSLRKNATGVAGSLPMQSVDPTAGTASVGGWSHNLDSGNYNFTAPVVSLPGRAGLGLSLALSYNSRVWTKYQPANWTNYQDIKMVFNLDRGFPAPGWQFGFGTILVKHQAWPPYANSETGAPYSIIYIAPDGTRHDLKQNPVTTDYESYDSSYLAFESDTRILKMPNGTRIHFTTESWANNDARFLPGLIKDRHGNQINIYHRTLSNGVVVMDYVIDTAGRRIDFNYQNNRLVSVSQNRGGEVFYYVRLDYQPVTIQTRFGLPWPTTAYGTDPSNINGSQVYFPVRISYPTGVNYRFQYTSYGQIKAIEKWVPTIAGQGNERKVASTSFNLPHQPGGGYQLDCPRFSSRTEWAENWQGGADVVYLYGAGEVLDPTQQRRFRLLTNGMVQSFSILPPGSEEWIKEDQTTWTSDSGLSYLSNPRVQETKSQARNSDNSITTKRSTFGYIQRDGMWLPNVRDDYNTASVYRRTITEYTSYPAQSLLGLPQTVSVYAGPGTTLLSSGANNYDETGTFVDSNNQSAPYFIDASGDGVIQHDNTNYSASFTARGNLTSVTQFSVVNGATNGSRIVKRVSYDTNGNVRTLTDGAGNRQQILYSDYYTNKPGGVGQTHVSPYTAADPTGFRAGSQWEYFTGLPVKTFNLLPGGTTELQVVTTSYDFADRPLQTTRPDGGWVKTAYWDNWVAAVTSQLVDSGKTRYKFEQYDGAGRAYRKASDHPDGVAGKYSGQIVVFNKLGQVEDSSNVVAINGSWTPSYEDASTGFVFTHLTRDELDRLKIVTFADNNTRQYSYDGCGCVGGSETHAMDELGRETITKTDFLGRLIEAIEPPPGNPNGVYSKAVYIYDELDRLREIRHSDTSGVKTQYRYFNYDGYGRLQSENTPEGGVVTYSYKPNDLVETAANQRNITVTYGYNTRNLVNNIGYSDGTPAVTYGYDEYGARNSMTDGEGSTSYGYNNFRQLQTETRTFTGLTNRTYKLSYTYNLADGVKQANYRIEQVTPLSTLYDKNVNYAYNQVGALGGVGTNLIGSDPNATTNVLNSVTYRGSGALRSVIYGNNRQTTMGYDPNRQQPTSMKVDRVGNPADKIIDYVYDYYDPNGNNNNRIRKITDNTDSAYTTNYLYDDYHRLQSATAGAYSRNYQYDPWGNITNFAGVTLSYQMNGSGAPATNRLSSDSQGINYSYDAAGNMTQAGSATYSYDGANRLKTAGGGTSTYGYDGDGKRVRVTDGGAAVFYVRSSMLGQVAMEVNSAGVRRAYVYSGNQLVAQQSTDGQFYWLHTNHLGSSRAMTDVNGNLVYKGQFDPYGQVLLEWGSASLNTKKFTGYERDGATGLDYAGARMYNSGRGRFMQPDPKGLGAANLALPESLNRYNYVRNDPVNFVDPGGTCIIYWVRMNENYGYWDSILCYDNPYMWIQQPEQPTPPDDSGIISLSFAEELIGFLKSLPSDCVEAFGGADKVAGWIKDIEGEKVTFHSWNSNAEIKDKDGNFHPQGRTVYDYWSYAKSTLDMGLLDPNPRGVAVISRVGENPIWDAHKWNKIVVGPTYKGGVTLLHEFLHWEVNGDHRTVADRDHLNLAMKGYDVSTEAKARAAINEFLESNCRDKSR